MPLDYFGIRLLMVLPTRIHKAGAVPTQSQFVEWVTRLGFLVFGRIASSRLKRKKPKLGAPNNMPNQSKKSVDSPK